MAIVMGFLAGSETFIFFHHRDTEVPKGTERKTKNAVSPRLCDEKLMQFYLCRKFWAIMQ